MNAARARFLRRLAGAVCPPKIAGTRDGALWADAAMGPLKRAWRKLSARERGRAGLWWAHQALDAALRGKRPTPAPSARGAHPKKGSTTSGFLKRGALKKARRALRARRKR